MSIGSIKLAMASGLSWLCATCKKYQDARAAGLPGQDCMALVTGSHCGSPLAGMSFPLYEGEVTDFQRFCFVCGQARSRGIKAAGSDRVFGVCERHGPAWAVHQKAQANLPRVLPQITHKSDWVPLDKAPRKKPLVELMLEFDPHTFDPLPTGSDDEGGA